MTENTLPPGVLLIGPTGSGKTPLGEWLSARGFDHWRFHHFDFGHRLRMVVSGSHGSCLFDAAERRLIEEILGSGRLLKNEEFFVADRLLRSFLSKLGGESHRADVIVLNGLPRNVFQAQRVAEIVAIRLVVSLDCDQEVVFQRIRSDAGGDRIGRNDDAENLVRERYAIYTQETKPLLAFYESLSVPIFDLPVTVSTTPAEMRSLFINQWRKLVKAQWRANSPL
ncbi:MAG: adenylate kinase family protein [Thermogutta sp.]